MFALFDGLPFDLDGTLWDATEGICAAWNYVLERVMPELAGTVTPERMRPCLGMLLPDIACKLFPWMDREECARIAGQCNGPETIRLCAAGSVLFPGVRETLEQLAGRYRLFIVSNCQDGYSEAFLQTHDLGGYFTDYECPGRTGKPKADNIALVVERNGLRRPLYIGDTQGDYNAATAAGVPFLHAAYGFGTIDRPVPAVTAFTQLPQAVAALENAPT